MNLKLTYPVSFALRTTWLKNIILCVHLLHICLRIRNVVWYFDWGWHIHYFTILRLLFPTNGWIFAFGPTEVIKLKHILVRQLLAVHIDAIRRPFILISIFLRIQGFPIPSFLFDLIEVELRFHPCLPFWPLDLVDLDLSAHERNKIFRFTSI